jgi:hypothetical protein
MPESASLPTWEGKPKLLKLTDPPTWKTKSEVYNKVLELFVHEAEKVTRSLSGESASRLIEARQAAIIWRVLETAKSRVDEFVYAHSLLPLNLVITPYFHSGSAVEYFRQWDTTFIINSHVDAAICGVGYLPVDGYFVTSVSEMQRHEMSKYMTELKHWLSEGIFPPGVGSSQSLKKGIPSRPIATFVSSKSSIVGFPFLSIIIDNKKVTNIAQLVANLYANIVTQIRFHSLDHPMRALGIISDGYKYTFVCLQLNTLDLTYKPGTQQPYNVIWIHEETLVLESSSAINPRVVEILSHIYMLAYVSSAAQFKTTNFL